MPLNLDIDGGDFLAILKYNSKAGRHFKRDRINEENVDTEVIDLRAIFDLERIQSGWLHFPLGSAPNWHPDPDIRTSLPQPTAEHKRAFRLIAYNPKLLDGVREFMQNSLMTRQALGSLYAQYEEEAAANQSKVPMVVCDGVEAVTNKHGTNYRPIYKITQWVARPDDLQADFTRGASALIAPTAPLVATTTPLVAAPADDEVVF